MCILIHFAINYSLYDVCCHGGGYCDKTHCHFCHQLTNTTFYKTPLRVLFALYDTGGYIICGWVRARVRRRRSV